MFKISPIQDKETQLRYAVLCGTSFVEGSFGYAMIDQGTGELMAFSQFEILGEVGHIYDIRPRIGYEDYEALFILGRQTMNFIDICGAHLCRANANAGEERLLRAIGFKMKDDGFYFSDMTGMFDGHCDGSTVQL